MLGEELMEVPVCVCGKGERKGRGRGREREERGEKKRGETKEGRGVRWYIARWNCNLYTNNISLPCSLQVHDSVLSLVCYSSHIVHIEEGQATGLGVTMTTTCQTTHLSTQEYPRVCKGM